MGGLLFIKIINRLFLSAMKFPIGKQDFKALREEGYVYVDKTALVYKMANEGTMYFLSRPRRFGKSLLLSTLNHYFRGNKQLFEGLAIAQLETEWKQHPVLRFNMNYGKFTSMADIHSCLRDNFSRIEEEYGRNREEVDFAERFSGAIRRAYKQAQQRVVVLIDEYDAPLQAALDNPELMEQFQNALRSLYICLKNNEEYIRFAFLTGITAWGKVGVFSTLNNLKDISFDTEYATLCGITEEELHEVFHEEVARLSIRRKISVENTYQKLKMQYDGYHFAEDAPGVYNPFSLLRALDSKTFENYWIETGRTLSVTTLVQHRHIDINELMDEVEATSGSLRSLESFQDNAIPFLYQAGYLTIKDFYPEHNTYTLQVPNTEVRESLGEHLIASTFGFEEDKSLRFRGNLRVAFLNCRFQEVVSLINTFVFYQGHHHAMGDKEVYFQTNLATLFRLIGFEVEVEKASPKGSADMVVKTDRHIYIIETKLNGTAQEALDQINERGYADPYQADLCKVVKVGLNFSETERIIDDYAFEI